MRGQILIDRTDRSSYPRPADAMYRTCGGEMRTMFKKIVVSIVIVLLTVTSAYAQGYGVGTPLEAKKMVEKAVAYLKAEGEEAALHGGHDIVHIVVQHGPVHGGAIQWRPRAIVRVPVRTADQVLKTL